MMNNMKTISITIDENLLRAVNRAAKSSRRTRSDLCRQALQSWLAGARRRELVREDRAGYQRLPVAPDEFAGLVAAQPFIENGEE